MRLLAALDLRDALTAVSLLLIGGGLSFVHVAAALAVPGLLLFLLAVVPPLIPRRGGS